MERRSTPSFVGLRPASAVASRAARRGSAKSNTRCELALRRVLWRLGIRYRLHGVGLPGRPDIVFPRQRVLVFCDGDFWHGRHLEARLARLARGNNAAYWIAKLRRNVERDLHQTRALEAAGWRVLRFWESDLLRDASDAADRVVMTLARRALNAQRIGHRRQARHRRSRPRRKGQ